MIEALEREEQQLEKEVRGIDRQHRAFAGRVRRFERSLLRSKDATNSLVNRLEAAAERIRSVRRHITSLRTEMRSLESGEPIPSRSIKGLEETQAVLNRTYRKYASMGSSRTLSALLSDRRVAIQHEILLLELEIAFGEAESLRWYVEEHNVDVGPVNRDSMPVTTGEQIDAMFDRL